MQATNPLYVEALNTALHNLCQENNKVILLGEDVADPYGGAFKVTKGLSSRFPNQIISTPISEPAITGVGIGLAMRGMFPIVEIMFGDFLTLCADQIINHASKFNWIYNNKVDVPLVIRTPMGGGRGYGSTHSQTLEALFLGTPILKILAPSHFHDPGLLLTHAVLNEQQPVLFIENKLLYPKRLIDNTVARSQLNLKTSLVCESDSSLPTVVVDIDGPTKPDAVIICYGGVAPAAIDAQLYLFSEEEINVRVILPSCIKPIPFEDLQLAVEKCGKLLVVEEGVRTGGWGAEISAQLTDKLFSNLDLPIQRIGAIDLPIPTSKPLEQKVLPDKDDIIRRICWIIQRGA